MEGGCSTAWGTGTASFRPASACTSCSNSPAHSSLPPSALLRGSGFVHRGRPRKSDGSGNWWGGGDEVDEGDMRAEAEVRERVRRATVALASSTRRAHAVPTPCSHAAHRAHALPRMQCPHNTYSARTTRTVPTHREGVLQHARAPLGPTHREGVLLVDCVELRCRECARKGPSVDLVLDRDRRQDDEPHLVGCRTGWGWAWA